MKRFMLDTNAASELMKENPALVRRVVADTNGIALHLGHQRGRVALCPGKAAEGKAAPSRRA